MRARKRRRLPQLPYLLREVDKRACLYEIVQRRAGWACVFYEPPEGYELPAYGPGWTARRDEWKRYLIVRRYFKTLRQALHWELQRIRKEAKAKPPTPVDRVAIASDPLVPAGTAYLLVNSTQESDERARQMLGLASRGEGGQR